MVNKRAYQKNWLLAADKEEIIMRKQMRRALNSFVQQYARQLQINNGAVDSILELQHKEKIKTILEKRYKFIVSKFSKFTFDAFRDDFTKSQQDVLINTQSQLTKQYIEENALNHATVISDTSIKNIRKKLDQGVSDGLGIGEIAASIRGVQAINSARAVLIARTEVHGAANYASIETARNAESEFNIIMEKEWIAVNDNRTRDPHAEANGQVVDMSEKFIVNGEEMDRPLDPTASADNVINCRCTLLFRKKKD